MKGLSLHLNKRLWDRGMFRQVYYVIVTNLHPSIILELHKQLYLCIYWVVTIIAAMDKGISCGKVNLKVCHSRKHNAYHSFFCVLKWALNTELKSDFYVYSWIMLNRPNFSLKCAYKENYEAGINGLPAPEKQNKTFYACSTQNTKGVLILSRMKSSYRKLWVPDL